MHCPAASHASISRITWWRRARIRRWAFTQSSQRNSQQLRQREDAGELSSQFEQVYVVPPGAPHGRSSSGFWIEVTRSNRLDSTKLFFKSATPSPCNGVCSRHVGHTTVSWTVGAIRSRQSWQNVCRHCNTFGRLKLSKHIWHSKKSPIFSSNDDAAIFSVSSPCCNTCIRVCEFLSYVNVYRR